MEAKMPRKVANAKNYIDTMEVRGEGGCFSDAPPSLPQIVDNIFDTS